MEEYNDWIDKIFPKDILYADGEHDDTIPLNILGNGGIVYHKKRKEYIDGKNGFTLDGDSFFLTDSININVDNVLLKGCSIRGGCLNLNSSNITISGGVLHNGK